MATIKKGSYRFKDTLSNYDGVAIPINFTSGSIVINEETLTATILQDGGTYQGIGSVDMSSGGFGNILVFFDTYNGGTSFTGLTLAYGFNGEGWQIWNALGSAQGVTVVGNGEYLKTITITADTEVSQEFYDWFYDNADVVIKKGVYKFKDVLTSPYDEGFQAYVYSYKMDFRVFYNSEWKDGQYMETAGDLNIYMSKSANESGWVDDVYSNGVWSGDGKPVNVYFPKDTTFDIKDPNRAGFSLWFYANTYESDEFKLIDGVWLMNEVLAEGHVSEHVKFLNQGFGFMECVDREYCHYMHMNGNSLYIEEKHYDILGEYSTGTDRYHSSGKWDAPYWRRVMFLEEQVVNTPFYDWFVANAVEITDDTVQILLGESRIGFLEDGQTMKVNCHNNILKEDIRVIAPKTEKTYEPVATESTSPVLKGVWRFNDTITATQGVSQNTNCKLIKFDHSIYMYIREISVVMYDSRNFTIHYSFQGYDGIITSSEYYSSNNGGWSSETYQNIYFPTPLTVSDEFYQWFTANAVDISNEVTYVSYDGEDVCVLKRGMTAKLPTTDLLGRSQIAIKQGKK